MIYADGTTDQTTLLAGCMTPHGDIPRTGSGRLSLELGSSPTWDGQDAQDASAPGAVHVALSGLLPARHSGIASAMLSDEADASWYFSAQGTPSSLDGAAGVLAFAFRVPLESNTADLYFPPIRNETGANAWTLVLTPSDLVQRSSPGLPGAASDLGLLSPDPAADVRGRPSRATI